MPGHTSQEPISRQPYWLVKDPNTQLMVKSTSQPAASGGFLGIGATPAPPPDGYIETFADGQKWDVPEDGSEPINLNTPAELQRIQAAQQPNQGTYPRQRTVRGVLYQQDDATGPWYAVAGSQTGDGLKTVETDQGIVGIEPSATRQVVPQGPDAPGLWGDPYGPQTVEQTGPQAQLLWPDPNASLRRDLLQAQIAQAQRVPAGPLGRQLTPAELRLQELNVTKAERELANPMLLAQQQLDEVITNLAQQYAAGKISLQERNRMMDLAKQGLTAQMMGTTSAGRAGVAGNLLGNESQLGGSLANSLLTNISGMSGRIMAGPTPLPNIDPFALARYGQQQLGAGPELTGMSRSILSGFLG